MSNAISKEQKQSNEPLFKDQTVTYRRLELDILDCWMAMDVNEREIAWDNYTQEEKYELLELRSELTNIIHTGFTN
jgi:hypothetical protein